MTTIVRPVRAEDVPAVVGLVTRTLAEFGITFGHGSPTDEELLRLPAAYEAKGGRFLVATEGATLLGTAGMVPVRPATLELRKMYLEPAARGRGVGQQLLDECLRFARAQQARQVVLDTTHQMTAAIAFYEKNGFVRDDEQISASRCSRGYRLDLAAM